MTMKANLKHPTATYTKSEKQALERFARAYGVPLDRGLEIRDNLALVGLALPRLREARR